MNFVADVDYRAATVMLTFAPSNQPGMGCTTIQIIRDDIPELPEQFSVILTSVSPAGIIKEDTACITIIDPFEIRKFTIHYNIPSYNIMAGILYLTNIIVGPNVSAWQQ